MSEAVFQAQQAKRDEQDALVEDRRQAVIERTQELLETDIEGRNPHLWEWLGVGHLINLPISRYREVAIEDQDVPWTIERGLILFASEYQAGIDFIEDQSMVINILNNAEATTRGILGRPVDAASINKTIKRKETQEDGRASTV